MGLKWENFGQQYGPRRGQRKGQTFQGMIEPEYLGLDELACYCSVSKKTLRKWLRRGMPHFKVGRLVRVRKGEFDAWLRHFRSGTSKDLDAILDQVMKEV